MRLLEVKRPNIIVVYGGGFQPFHEGHASSYREAKAAFPDAYFFVAASNVTSERPFEFKEKQFLAQQAGVVDPFIQVGTMSYVNDNGRKVTSTPLNPLEALQPFNPEKDVLIIVRSERDPMNTTDVSYYQPWQGRQGAEPFSKHAYVFVTKKHDFKICNKGVCSGSQVRKIYSGANDKTKLTILRDLYPQSRQLDKIKKIFDKRLAVAEGVAEGLEHFNGIEISMEKENDEIMVTAMMSGGRELGHVLFIIDGEHLMPQDLEVDERYQGQGIAATMYDYVKSKGYKIRRSGQQTDAGAGFWDKHKPGKNVWEQDVDEASLATMRDFFAGDKNAQDPLEITKQRLHYASKDGVTARKEFRNRWEYEQWLKQLKLKQVADGREYNEEEEASNLLEYLRKIHKRWAIVSKREGRPLVYFKGDGRPSKEWVEKQERRINHLKRKK